MIGCVVCTLRGLYLLPDKTSQALDWENSVRRLNGLRVSMVPKSHYEDSQTETTDAQSPEAAFLCFSDIILQPELRREIEIYIKSTLQ